MISRRRIALVLGLSALSAKSASGAPRPRLTVYKSATCGCCKMWCGLMEKAGFSLDIRDTDQLDSIREKAGIGPELTACHTAFVAGYVVEGHVPPPDVLRLLGSNAPARGLAVPGMPTGSPGMPMVGKRQAFDTLLIEKNGQARIYAHHT